MWVCRGRARHPSLAGWNQRGTIARLPTLSAGSHHISHGQPTMRTAHRPTVPPRFLPTCSRYSMDAYRGYGVWKGTVLTAWRLMRCNPWGAAPCATVGTWQHTWARAGLCWNKGAPGAIIIMQLGPHHAIWRPGRSLPNHVALAYLQAAQATTPFRGRPWAWRRCSCGKAARPSPSWQALRCLFGWHTRCCLSDSVQQTNTSCGMCCGSHSQAPSGLGRRSGMRAVQEHDAPMVPRSQCY